MLDRLKEAKDFIFNQQNLQPDIAITLGSGLSDFVSQIQNPIFIDYKEIPGFSTTSVEGHPGKMVFGTINDKKLCVLQGRVHFYEGHSLDEVCFATRLMKFIGCSQIILTNSSGGMLDQMQAGDFMIIEDHINLTGQNPLIGPNLKEFGPRFPDMSEVYSKMNVQLLEKIFTEKNYRFHKGIYCGVTGPSYETPAEIKYMKTIGGGAVGMSTVPEAIAAKHIGLEVCGLSCITNLASGISKTPLTHEEVKEEAALAAQKFNEVLTDLVIKM